LVGVAEACEAVAARPSPPPWRWWDVRDLAADLKHGPRYSPRWFGGLTATEAGRIRVLRALYGLADAGLVTLVKSEGAGRLQRARLTEAGREAVAGLRKAEAAAPVGS
jgi:hypothetical protein